ncbi:hypothetical protein DL93DRAFT_1211265 [Clavulina sp. PMI_390]|nr:hypothetical protein DL93DRAFT_1211265 [Clavulina sp. PMI_390]
MVFHGGTRALWMGSRCCKKHIAHASGALQRCSFGCQSCGERMPVESLLQMWAMIVPHLSRCQRLSFVLLDPKFDPHMFPLPGNFDYLKRLDLTGQRPQTKGIIDIKNLFSRSQDLSAPVLTNLEMRNVIRPPRSLVNLSFLHISTWGMKLVDPFHPTLLHYFETNPNLETLIIRLPFSGQVGPKKWSPRILPKLQRLLAGPWNWASLLSAPVAKEIVLCDDRAINYAQILPQSLRTVERVSLYSISDSGAGNPLLLLPWVFVQQLDFCCCPKVFSIFQLLTEHQEIFPALVRITIYRSGGNDVPEHNILSSLQHLLASRLDLSISCDTTSLELAKKGWWDIPPHLKSRVKNLSGRNIPHWTGEH